MNKAIIFDYNRTIFNPETGILFPGAIELIRKYKGNDFKIFLVAKGGKDRVKQVNELGIATLFDKVFIEPEKTVDAFLQAQKLCEEGTIFYVVGDRVKREIKFGNQCGMTTIWIKNGKFASETASGKTEEPNHTVESLRQIEELIGL